MCFLIEIWTGFHRLLGVLGVISDLLCLVFKIWWLSSKYLYWVRIISLGKKTDFKGGRIFTLTSHWVFAKLLSSWFYKKLHFVKYFNSKYIIINVNRVSQVWVAPNSIMNSSRHQFTTHYQLINYANNSSTQGDAVLPWPCFLLAMAPGSIITCP